MRLEHRLAVAALLGAVTLAGRCARDRPRARLRAESGGRRGHAGHRQRYVFPDWGLYDGESLIFKRDALGQASEVVAAEVRFVRRPAGPTANGTFLITPLEPVARLRERALAASPPVENVTKVFWDATPADKRIFVADPSQGSRHNRGCAVDLTLFSLATGKPVEMPGVYDEMSERSYPGYVGGTALQRWHRERLGDAMEEQDFTVYEFEWWHFDYKDWRQYPILNLPFERLGPAQAGRTPSAEAAPE